MKKFSAGVVLGFLASWALVFASPNFNHNGDFWNKLNGSAKGGYVDGYNDAMEVSVGKLESLNIAADLFHWKGAGKIIHQLSSELATNQIEVGDTVRKLDKLYSNPKYSELELGQALQLIAAKDQDISAPVQPAAAQTIRK